MPRVYEPGSAVRLKNKRWGTLGVKCWYEGKSYFLTAGHVAENYEEDGLKGIRLGDKTKYDIGIIPFKGPYWDRGITALGEAKEGLEVISEAWCVYGRYYAFIRREGVLTKHNSVWQIEKGPEKFARRWGISGGDLQLISESGHSGKIWTDSMGRMVCLHYGGAVNPRGLSLIHI